jgi:hypothetical protein
MWEYLRRLERVNDTVVAKFLDLFEEDPRRSAHKFEVQVLGPRNRFGARIRAATTWSDFTMS